MARRNFSVLLVVVFLSAFQAAVSAQQYTVREIKTFGGNASTPGGINDHLRVAGSANEANGLQIHGYLWGLRGVTDIGSPGLYSEGDALNIADQVVGCAVFPSGETHAYLWTAATGVQDLGTLGGTNSCAKSVNSLGTVVGFSLTSTGAEHAFLWTQSGGMQDLDQNEGASVAFGINDKGQVVGGYVAANSISSRAFIWSQARGMRTLPSPTGTTDIGAVQIDNAGHVVGSVAFAGGGQAAVLWPHLGEMGVQVLPQLPGGSHGGAHSVNLNEEVVGVGAASTGAGDAFLWTPSSGTQDLNDMIPANSGWVVNKAIGINDLGAIVAVGTHASDINTHTLLLQPVKP